MDVKVGIKHSTREVSVETDQSADDVQQAFTKAYAEGGTFELKDSKGGRTIIVADSVAYLDLGSEQARPVGFGTV